MKLLPAMTAPYSIHYIIESRSANAALRSSGIGARTIGHAHRVLGRALRDAEKHGLVTKNVCRTQGAPKVEDDPDEMDKVIVRDVPAFITALRSSERFYVPATIAL